MRNLSSLGLGLVLGSFLFACAASSDEDPTVAATGAATATLKITSGAWAGGALKLVVADGAVSGAYSTTKANPMLGDAECRLTLAGTITTVDGAEHAEVVASDGWSSTVGELVATTENGAPALRLRAKRLLNGCSEASPMLTGAGHVMTGTTALPADVVGYGSVVDYDTFFYTYACGPIISAIPRGATVERLDNADHGYLMGRYAGDGLFPAGRSAVKAASLSSTGGAEAPRTGKFALTKSPTVASSLEVTKASASEITFDLDAKLLGSDPTASVKGGVASFENGVATWKLDACEISFIFTDGGTRVSVGHFGYCPTFGSPDIKVMGNYTAQ